MAGGLLHIPSIARCRNWAPAGKASQTASASTRAPEPRVSDMFNPSGYPRTIADISMRNLPWLHRPMRLEEGMDVAHGQGNPLLRFFPGEHAHFGLRREHRALHGDGV